MGFEKAAHAQPMKALTENKIRSFSFAEKQRLGGESQSLGDLKSLEISF
jgi:hypothetical protein